MPPTQPLRREGLSYSAETIEKFGAGGLSGAPLTKRSHEVVSYIRTRIKTLANPTPIQIIGVGGIMNAQDAMAMFAAGADLVQLYSGFIYQGPQLIRDINQAVLQAGNR